MQWSSDRNGGFSRADPEQLVLPPVMGSLYGFDAVNVESQSRDPHSLLNWMRRMLVTRRARQAFGRGRIRFLRPSNRKVLAYLRELDGESPVLCVANLGRAPEAVELDLSEFAGSVPVEMTADSAFPPIGQLTYLLTLPPYGFYWFTLCADGVRPSWSVAPSEQLPEFVTFVVRKGVQLPSATAQQRTLETEVLPTYLGMRRWFAAKDAALRAVRLAYYSLMTPGVENILLAEVEADLSASDDVSGAVRTERYFLPLAVSWDNSATASPLPQQLALARVRSGRTVGYLTDAFSLSALPHAMIRMLHEKARVQTPQGEVTFLPSAALQQVLPAETTTQTGNDAPEIRWLAAEQSNSSLVIGDAAVLKLVRRVVPGIHPEAEMTRYLTERAYANTAALLGEVVRTDASGEPHTLAILQGFIENQGDAWHWVLDYLRRATDDLAVAVTVGLDDATAGKTAKQTGKQPDPGPSIREEDYAQSIEGYGAMAATIGTRLGELHVILAAPSDDPAFSPEVASASDVKGWISETVTQLDDALDTLSRHVDALDDDARALATTLLARRKDLVRAVKGIVGDKPVALRTRIHGDFHLGQILVAQLDAYLIDFEGEPARSVADRRRKMSPYRDVAGLLRSLSYAGAAALTATANETAQLPSNDRRRMLLEAFSARARDRFLEAYRTAIASAAQPLADARTEAALIDLFLVEKAAYEIRYEAANRPTWLALPLRGLAALAARLLGDTDTNAASDVAGAENLDRGSDV